MRLCAGGLTEIERYGVCVCGGGGAEREREREREGESRGEESWAVRAVHCCTVCPDVNPLPKPD
jgi:hypothetical protein